MEIKCFECLNTTLGFTEEEEEDDDKNWKVTYAQMLLTSKDEGTYGYIRNLLC